MILKLETVCTLAKDLELSMRQILKFIMQPPLLQLTSLDVLLEYGMTKHIRVQVLLILPNGF